MRRRSLIAGGGVGLVGAALAAPAIAQSQPEIKWRMATSWPKSLDTIYGGAEYLAKRVAEMTDNKFQIRAFAGGEIVPALQVLDAVQNNTVEMVTRPAITSSARIRPSASTVRSRSA
jgi:TRAP-type mannitol/chloroaromatic compound transport system substrate-binding protein